MREQKLIEMRDVMKYMYKYLLVAMCFLAPATLSAQEATDYWAESEHEDFSGVIVTPLSVSLTGDSVVVVLEIEAERLKIRPNRSLSLDVKMIGVTGDSVRLPSVIYSGGQRARFDRRERKQMKPVEGGIEPYAVYKRVKPHDDLKLRYEVSTPLQGWMDNVSLVVDQVVYDCCNDWLVGSEVLLDGLNVDPDPIVELSPRLHVWSPAPAVYSHMVSFLTPEVEAVKSRVAIASVNIDYPVNGVTVLPKYGKNAAELPKVDTLMSSILGEELIKVNSLIVTGYASPEGRYSANESLARRRSQGFKSYIQSNYKLGGVAVNTKWIAEDWDGVVAYLTNSELDYAEGALDVIANNPVPDTREAKLKSLQGGVPFRELLTGLFPSLRRIELRADYTVVNIVDKGRIKELMKTRPELLSLEEIYSVALEYKPGSAEYRGVYELAAKYFPKDIVANNNAAAAVILESGDAKTAMSYLESIKSDPRVYVNLGVVSYLDGDFEQARMYFEQAQKAGFEAGEQNIKLLNQTR